MPLRALLFLSISGFVCLVTLKKPFWGLCFFALTVYIHPIRFSYGYLADFHIPFIVASCTLIGYLFNYGKFKKSKEKSLVIGALFGLALMQVISSIFAKFSPAISFHYSQVMLKIVVYCFLIVRLIDSKEKLKTFLIINLIGAGFLSVWGIEQHFRGNERLENMAGTIFAESNSMAALWVLVLPLFLIMALEGKGKIRILGGLMCASLVSSTVFTQSRAGLMGLAIGSAVLFLRLPGKRKVFFIMAALSLFVIFKAATMDVKDYAERADSITEHEAMESRLLGWKAAWTAFNDYPLTGVGQQNFQHLAKEYFQRLKLPMPFRERFDVHNTPLLLLCEGGIIAFLLYMSAIFFYFKDTIKLRKMFLKSGQFRKYISFLAALESGIIAFLTCAMVHSYPIYEVFYWFLVIPTIMRKIYSLELLKGKNMGEIPPKKRWRRLDRLWNMS